LLIIQVVGSVEDVADSAEVTVVVVVVDSEVEAVVVVDVVLPVVVVDLEAVEELLEVGVLPEVSSTDRPVTLQLADDRCTDLR
jgi:hypothetical protein